MKTLSRLIRISMIFLLIIFPISCYGDIDLTDMQGWQIIIPQAASEAELFAAEQFQTFLLQSADIHLPIKHGGMDCNKVFIGYNRQSELEKLKSAEYGEEGFAIAVEANNIYIAGGRPRGTLYGVYTFLEDYIGVRFLTADHTYVPKIVKNKKIKSVYRTYVPPLRYRHVYSGELIIPQDDSTKLFLNRLRINALEANLPDKLGTTVGLSVIGHSFGSQMPTRLYGAEHPEYYALYENRRLSNVENDWSGTQLCLTNHDVLQKIIAVVEREIDKSPKLKNFSVGQNDNYFFCRCDKCRTIDEQEGTPMGSLLTFVNAVAEHIEKQHPDVMIGTLAYQYSRKPPLYIRPRSNVQIQLCSIECCIMHPINDSSCPLNVSFCEDMHKWSKICNNIHVWSYNGIFDNYLLPCPNLRVIESNIKYFVSNNVRGIFMQGAYNTLASEFSDLRNYVTARLLWNPNQSSEKLIDEFITLHYGKAAAPIKDYINFLHNKACSSGKHTACFGKAKDYAINNEVIDFGLNAFDNALKLAENETIRERVEKASISIYRAKLEPIWYITSSPTCTEEQIEKLTPCIQRFLEICSRNGINPESQNDIFKILISSLDPVNAPENKELAFKLKPVTSEYLSLCSRLNIPDAFSAATYIYQKKLNANQNTAPDIAKYKSLVEHFLKLCEKYNVTRPAEYTTMAEKSEQLKKILNNN